MGDNNVDCRYNGTHVRVDCYLPSGTNGALSTQAISSISLAAAGSGYTSTPTCTINVPSNKSRYEAPTVKVIYAGGTQATCKATINTTTKVVTAVSLTNKGEGYPGVPICTISGGGGTGAKCMLTITRTMGATAYQPAYGATPGWDMVTGIGSVNAYNLVFDSAWQNQVDRTRRARLGGCPLASFSGKRLRVFVQTHAKKVGASTRR